MIIDHRHLDSLENSSHSDNSRRQSPTPNQSYSSVEPPVPGPTISPTAVDAPINLPMHNPADMGSIFSSSPALPVTPTDASPISDSSTRLSAIQTVQTYLSHQTQTIQSHLTAVLPGLIQGEVRIQCGQLAQEIGAQISSIQEEVINPIEDQDDPMLPSSEGENEGSRRCTSYSKKGGKGGMTHRHSPQSNNGDEGSEKETDEEGISSGSRKYKKQIQALRVSICFLLFIVNTD